MSEPSRDEILRTIRAYRREAEGEEPIPFSRDEVPPALAEFLEEAEVLGATDEAVLEDVRERLPRAFATDLWERWKAKRPILDAWMAEIPIGKSPGYARVCFTCLDILLDGYEW